MTANSAQADYQDAVIREAANRRQVRTWLYVVVLALFALVLVGGATRLTDSGLSITEWKPIHGVIPPLSDAEWSEEFEKYQADPRISRRSTRTWILPVSRRSSGGNGRTGYWRAASASCLRCRSPFSGLTGKLESAVKPKLAGILALGGLQGFVGWWMVASGLVDRVDVSQYRLATHLVLASLILAATMLVARGLAPHSEGPSQGKTRRMAGFLVLLVLVQIYLGALVAGLDAGMAYNTWPLMDGKLVPDGLMVMQPAWRNLFENALTVQFIHRLGAYLVWIIAVWHMAAALGSEPGTTHARRAVLLFVLVTVQAGLGIFALVTQVQLHAALAHQGMALIVLAFAAAHWRGTKGSYMPQTAIAVAH